MFACISLLLVAVYLCNVIFSLLFICQSVLFVSVLLLFVRNLLLFATVCLFVVIVRYTVRFCVVIVRCCSFMVRHYSFLFVCWSLFTCAVCYCSSLFVFLSSLLVISRHVSSSIGHLCFFSPCLVFVMCSFVVRNVSFLYVALL